MPLDYVKYRSVLLCAALAMLAGACSDEPRPSSCESAAASALGQCVADLNEATRACYLATGSTCSPSDEAVRSAYRATEDAVQSGCDSDETVQRAGYGPSFTVAALGARLVDSCRAESSALASRSFGGPQGAALAGASSAAERDCLVAAHEQGADVLQRAFEIRSACVQDARGCDATVADGAVAGIESEATAGIAASCPALQTLVAIDPGQFVARTDLQTQCLTAIAHPDVAPLDLDCGPRAAVSPAPRGQWMQVVLDESVFGTRCGDGSPYAFQLRLAPEGFDVGKVVVGMEGGGVCVFEDDCDRVGPDLFEALSDPPFELGPLSNDPSFSPFGNWTKVFLPYCTQDVFIGGGATSDFPSITVHRFGGVNTRAALQYVRDVIWRVLDQETEGGYRADAMRVLFGGFSAGGFGTLYNYHYVLDDLQWRHTAAYPDAALALDNGEALGVRGLGAIASSSTPPLGWGAMSFLPPYCFATDCGVGPVMLEATAPRLKAVPEQQFLILSNQVDQVQVGTTFFASTPDWINELRSTYCETRDLNGVNYYMPAIPQSVHVISPRPELYADFPVDGVIMRDWLATAFQSTFEPKSWVVEGDLVEAFPGVNPFPCALEP